MICLYSLARGRSTEEGTFLFHRFVSRSRSDKKCIKGSDGEQMVAAVTKVL